MVLEASLTLILTFAVLLLLSVPIGICIAVASTATMLLMMPMDRALFITAQKMVSSLDTFALLAVPFFILSGEIMNNGGIAARLVNFAKLFSGKIPGSLTHTNIVGNMMFGAVSGSAIAASTSIGGVMVPMSEKEGYQRTFAAAANIASAPTGMLIPPTTAFIIYALVSGGTSIAALFMGGAVAGILWGLGCMVVAYVVAKRHNYPMAQAISRQQAWLICREALPSLLLIFIVVGGIVFGVFTAIEASAVAVLYTAFLSLVVYKSIKLIQLPAIMMSTVRMTGIIMFLLAASSAMSFAMAFSGLPAVISEIILGLADNQIMVLLIINILLLIIGTFMDIGPAILIFTPILLPIATQMGVDPVHFGVVMIYNLSIGTITPPVGSGLFVGASVAQVRVESLIKPLLPFYLAIILVLFVVTYIPQLTLFLPQLFGV
ncbi:TRAP transporter large permease [Marinobacterium sedimentorum]|uniref:TRAP transporter large permease n=1 Tax=Marinobacterium sedimentorum TaxID=2927804 RepID=UPI0020C7143A|nr:TRAP transporter large permease [Marinobacterium sedimentorum]MCP8688836.1 TRAP transporter large permease [Marinobacterium sedimentorum]